VTELDALRARAADLERQVDQLRRELVGLREIRDHIRAECDRALGEWPEVYVPAVLAAGCPADLVEELWSPEWQALEAEASADLAAGRYVECDTMDELIAALKEEDDDLV